MNTSELIAQLQSLKDQYGDLEVGFIDTKEWKARLVGGARWRKDPDIEDPIFILK